MTDTSNQNPVQSPSDNPFFRPVSNDPASVAAVPAPDPGITPQSPPAPTATIVDPMTTTQPSVMTTDTPLTSSVTDNTTMPVSTEVMPATTNTEPVLPELNNNMNPVQTEMPAVDTMPSTSVMDNNVSGAAPLESAMLEPMSSTSAASAEPAITEPMGSTSVASTVPAMTDSMSSVTTMPTDSSVSEVVNTDSLPGSAPVMPPQVTPDLGATASASPELPPTLTPIEPALDSVDKAVETSKETLPDLNNLSSQMPDLATEAKPLETVAANDPSPVSPMIDTSAMNMPATDSLPSMDALATGTGQSVQSPALEPQPEVVTSSNNAQPELAPMESVSAAPTLPPLEPVAQPDPVNMAMETPVVAPIAQEVPPVATAEAQEVKPEAAPATETAPAPVGKMKNLVLLLGVLVVGIMALVLGIIVASTQ